VARYEKVARVALSQVENDLMQRFAFSGADESQDAFQKQASHRRQPTRRPIFLGKKPVKDILLQQKHREMDIRKFACELRT
jgi:hypothetical protein